MDDESLEQSSAVSPSPDRLCSACQTINGEALLKTGPFQHGTDYMYYNEAGELEKEYSVPDNPGIYHTKFLENPAASVETCAACRLFHNVTYSGITLSESAVLRLCLRKERDLVEVEDMVKIERERERAQKVGETPNLNGKGRVSVFADYGKLT